MFLVILVSYILELLLLLKSTEHLNASVKIKEMDALNTSDHTLILATVGVDVKRAAPKAAKIHCQFALFASFDF
jgi:hypothetical protein